MKTTTMFSLTLMTIFLMPATSRAQWVRVGPLGGSVWCFTVNGNYLFSGINGRIYRSTDYGVSWTEASTGVSVFAVKALAFTQNGTGGANYFAGTWGNDVYISTNNGSSWQGASNGLPYTYFNAFAVRSIGAGEDYLFGGAYGVFLTTNNGGNWTATGLTNTVVQALAVSNTNVFAGTNEGGIFLSTNNGESWTTVNTNLTNNDVRALVVSGANIFAATNGGGISLSTNNGGSWTAVNTGLAIMDVRALAISGISIFAGINGGGVYFSTNNGGSWAMENTGLGDWNVQSLAVTDSSLFAGTQNVSGGIWRRPLSEMITSAENHSSDLQPQYSLKQNWPNPFNPSTTISFNIRTRSYVTLRVFDIIGREVTTLVSNVLSAGPHSYQWDPHDLPSGVYFYRLQAGSFVETRKLMLLR
jgi:hypothetical protein